MSFFRREEDGLDPVPPMSRTPEPRTSTAMTLVAPGTRIEGTVTGGTEVRVDGEVAGDVRVEGGVSIGRQGKVEGSVAARNVLIAGAMEGDVQATDRIVVEASGVAHGDLSAPRVVIAEGAFFKGRVEMGARSGGRAAGGSAPAGGKEAVAAAEGPR